MPRFFVPQEQIPIISGSDAHQIQNVLRMKIGDQLELLDGSGKAYLAEIEQMSNDKISCKIKEHRTENTEHRTQITIAQANPKLKKMDLIIQKCTELGVSQIIPMITERTIAKGEKKERWQKIAKEAAEQSGRTTIPTISTVIKFAEVLKMKDQFDLALIPWEMEQDVSLKSSLQNHKSQTILVLVGPEGGFSQNEVELAKQAGFISITLGKTILRTETAGLAIMAMINYEQS